MELIPQQTGREHPNITPAAHGDHADPAGSAHPGNDEERAHDPRRRAMGGLPATALQSEATAEHEAIGSPSHRPSRERLRLEQD